MKNNNFWKNFIMAMITMAAALISDMETVIWSVVGITMLGNAIVYYVKNKLLPSTSPNGSFNVRDFISGAIMAVGTLLSSSAATFLINDKIGWAFVGKAIFGVLIGYVVKTFKSDLGSLKKTS
jgi:hypothetical protein